LWGVRLTATELARAQQLNFTRCYPGGWENVDHHIELGHDIPQAAVVVDAS
jgi:hypothetical protein